MNFTSETSDWTRVLIFLAATSCMAMLSGLFIISDWTKLIRLLRKKNEPVV
jgi:hypothetical protein